MTKLQAISQSRKVMNQAWTIYRAGTRNFSLALKEAWKQVRAVAAALKKGIVSFWKMDGSTTTRRIAPLADVDYTPKGTGKSTDTVKVIDLDKLESGLAPEKCIISFHPYQIIEELDLEFHAQDIYEKLEVPFEHADCTIEGTLIKVKTDIPGSLDWVYVTVRVTADDTVESVEDRLIQELQEWIQQVEFNQSTWVDFRSEQGYGCTGSFANI